MNDRILKVEVDGRVFDVVDGENSLVVDGQPVDASVVHVSGRTYSILVDGRSSEVTVITNGSTTSISSTAGTHKVALYDRLGLLLKESEASARGPASTEVRSPMPGLVLKIEVSDGQSIQSGAGLLVLEAMKMENEIFSSSDAVIKQIHVQEGEAVTKGQLLITLG